MTHPTCTCRTLSPALARHTSRFVLFRAAVVAFHYIYHNPSFVAHQMQHSNFTTLWKNKYVFEKNDDKIHSFNMRWKWSGNALQQQYTGNTNAFQCKLLHKIEYTGNTNALQCKLLHKIDGDEATFWMLLLLHLLRLQLGSILCNCFGLSVRRFRSRNARSGTLKVNMYYQASCR